MAKLFSVPEWRHFKSYSLNHGVKLRIRARKLKKNMGKDAPPPKELDSVSISLSPYISLLANTVLFPD